MAAMFEDRSDAGARLARALAQFRGCGVTIAAIPRGGVPVARRVAEALGAPLETVSIRRPRLSGGENLPDVHDLSGETVIVVDDGVATGATARLACRAVRSRGAAKVVLAVPVAPPGWARTLLGEADAFVAIATPHPFWSVGQWYTRFDGVTDAELEAGRHVPGTDSGKASAVPANFRVKCDSAGGHGDQHTPEAQMAATSHVELR
jgi:predicted phosphoribosyltransferase